MANEENRVARVERRVRFDLVIALCALLISTLATGASWWQARVLQAQTQVLQEQLGAQVWPYVSVAEGIDGDRAEIDVANDGLGPAVLRSASVTVDGIPKSNFIDVLHAVLGPHLVARNPHGEKIGIAMNGATPGSVLRPGESSTAFALTSRHYARPLAQAFKRLTFRICYCAIVPGKCWFSDSSSTGDPQPVAVCHGIPHDLLHVQTVDELFDRNY